MARTIAVLVAASVLVVVIAAQQPPAFEVASARVVLDMNAPTSEDFRFSDIVTEQRVHLVQFLRTILLRALRVQDYELVAPAWTNGWLVEIRGTLPAGATTEQVPDMLRGLLVERFGMRTHTEARTMEAYHLVVGATGIKMNEVEAVNELEKEFRDVLMSNGSPLMDRVTQTADGPVRTMAIPGGTRRITSRTSYDRLSDPDGSGTRTISAARMTMAELVSILAPNIGESVFDGTGLKGIYQFTLELPQDEVVRQALLKLRAARGFAGTSSTDVTADNVQETATTLKAVEKLGLRLERRRVPVDVVVIDSIQRQPSQN